MPAGTSSICLCTSLPCVCVSPSQYFEQAVTVFAHSAMLSSYFLSGLALHQGFFPSQTYGVTMWKGKTIAFFFGSSCTSPASLPKKNGKNTLKQNTCCRTSAREKQTALPFQEPLECPRKKPFECSAMHVLQHDFVDATKHPCCGPWTCVRSPGGPPRLNQQLTSGPHENCASVHTRPNSLQFDWPVLRAVTNCRGKSDVLVHEMLHHGILPDWQTTRRTLGINLKRFGQYLREHRRLSQTHTNPPCTRPAAQHKTGPRSTAKTRHNATQEKSVGRETN